MATTELGTLANEERIATARDAASSAIVLLAFILNCDGALERYFTWLIKQGVLTEATGLPSEAEYREHLQLMQGHFMGNFEALTEMLGGDESAEPGTAGETLGATNARRSSAVAVRGPAHAFQPGRGGGRHRLQYVA